MKTRCLNCMSEYESELGLCPNCGYDPGEPMENTLHMKPGSLLHGRYLVGRALGSGGFGITYVGWDFTLQQKAAIKEYLPSEFATRALGETQVTVYSGNKGEQYNSGLEKFVEEARHLAKFQNTDGIVRVFDSFKENNTAYIIMEYLEGETLASYMEHAGKIPVDEAVAILEPAMHALEAVHAEGIIHRDIAPDNIFLTTDGHVRVIDFGASRYATTSHSRSLTVIIKQGYSPEEQYRSRGDQGPHTDVYAMGAVLYRMITGITPPDAMERRAYFETENKDILVPPSKNCKIDKNKENAILNAMNVRIEDRTKTITAFLEELKSDKPVARVSGKIRAFDMMRWPLWAKISIPAAALVAVALMVLLLTGRIGFLDNLNRDAELAENETRVVEVTNQSLGVAQELLYGESIKSVAVEYLPYDDIATNVVIEQDYSAGSIVEEGTVVSLYLSNSTSSLTSTEKNTMPSVLYRTLEEAAAMLEEAGVAYSVTEVNSIYAEGTVIWANRLEGDAISDSDAVELVVSKGAAEEDTLSVNLDATSLYVGDAITLTVTGMSGSCTWSSSDETIASVDNDGRVTANEEGTVIITASVGDDLAICYLTVFDYSIRIKTGKMAIFAGGTATVTVSGAPGGTVFEWNSSDDSVAEVKSGSIYGTGNGTAEITANCTINGRTYTTAPVSVTVTTNGVILSSYDISGFYVGDSIELTAETNPENGEIIWESSDPDIVSVKDGVVIGVGEGTAEILAKFDEYEAVCSVTVTEPRISISGAKDTLPVDDTVTLNCVFTPSGQAINWTSSNSKICTVDASGTVTAVAAGTATITAGFTYQGIEYSDTYEMTVKDRVLLSASSAELTVTNTKKLTVTTDPSGQSVTWSSSNTDIATVSSDGTVTAVGEGSATITAKTTINGKSYSAACTVEVNPPTIGLSSSSLSLTVTETSTLSATVEPSGFSVTWSSNNTSVATVSNSGIVAAVGEGNATITAKITINGKSYSAACTVKVNPPTISLFSSSLSLTVTETGTLSATVDPSGLSVTWSSSDTDVATVSSTGTVTAVGEGSATITAMITVNSKSYTAKCSVNVVAPSVSISKSTMSLVVSETGTLSATANPSSFSVTWSSSNTGVATVSSSGVVTAVGEGTATLTAKITVNSKSYTATCTVSVTAPSVTLSSASLSLYIGYSSTLTASTSPSGQSVTWSSSNTSVATVSSSGTVKAVAAGSATVTASITLNSKSYSAACTVKVSAPSISLSSSSLSLTAGDTSTLTASVTPSGQSVTWDSSNSSVATVASSGIVTAVSAGSTTITATIKGTSYKASCTVSVTAAASTLGFVNMNLPYSGAVSSNYDINKIEYYLLRNGDEIKHGTLGGGLGTYWDLQGLIDLMMKYATSSGSYTMGFYVYDSSGEEAGYGKAFNIE